MRRTLLRSAQCVALSHARQGDSRIALAAGWMCLQNPSESEKRWKRGERRYARLRITIVLQEGQSDEKFSDSVSPVVFSAVLRAVRL